MNIYESKAIEAGQVFTPGSPVNERDLFAGRVDQLNRIIQASSQRGYHAVLYGERGVGKTSLANILAAYLRTHSYMVSKVNCVATDDFSSLWRRAFADITMSETLPGVGFTASPTTNIQSLSQLLPDPVQPDHVRRTLEQVSGAQPTLIILDEYDRLESSTVATQVSDTIKSLSDFGVPASILLIGVADSVEELIQGHNSIERALVQIPMPRMQEEEIRMIVDKGLQRLGMAIDGSACSHLISLSQGLPYIAHLLGLHSARAALGGYTLSINRDHVDAGIRVSLDQWVESVKMGYYNAVKSPQPGNIFREVLLACAMAEVDELGYFTAAAVRAPLSKIVGRDLDIPNFARHLKEFSQESRGRILTRTGEKRKLRYRFVSPLMRPYIIMRGYSDNLLS